MMLIGLRRVLLFRRTTAAAAAAGYSPDGSMDISFLGRPFVDGAAQTSTSLNTMDFSFLGQPFVRYSYI